GGMSHLDTLDPKEGETAGPVKSIRTSAKDMRIAEYLPLTARQMHHAAIVRSLTSTQGAHEQGNYKMHTSYDMRGTIRHPGMGAWLNALQGGGNTSLPNYIYIGGDSRHPGAGFLPAAHGPLSISNPETGVKNIPRHLQEQHVADRLAFAAELDQEFRDAHAQR